MIFFNYIFYRISSAVYKSKIERQNPEASGGALISFLQLLNFIEILYFVFNIKMTKELYILSAIPIFTIGWIFFYNRKSLKKYKSKWDTEKKKSKQIKGYLIIAYMLITIILYGLVLSDM